MKQIALWLCFTVSKSNFTKEMFFLWQFICMHWETLITQNVFWDMLTNKAHNRDLIHISHSIHHCIIKINFILMHTDTCFHNHWICSVFMAFIMWKLVRKFIGGRKLCLNSVENRKQIFICHLINMSKFSRAEAIYSERGREVAWQVVFNLSPTD